MAHAEQERRDAVRRYLQGEAPNAIYRALGRTRYWLYKWLKRYDPRNPRWPQALSRAPKRRALTTPEQVVRLVCATRKRLLETKYAQKGALAIQWQLQQAGIKPVPALWTINRILKRQGLVVKPTYQPRGTPYPALAPPAPHRVQQLDLVGPRYLQGGTRFYGLHTIDTYSHAVALEAMGSKRATEIVEAVVAAWQRLGIPQVLQLDNELAFRGSNRYPRSFGLLIRLCLYLRVEPRFIPEGEPWRNGIIERFNGVYDALFFRQQTFADQSHLQRELPHFERFHNTQHRYATLQQRTPWHVHTVRRPRLLPRTFTRHRRVLPWRDGRVSFVRLTDAEGCARFFTESFVVDRCLVHEYVTGTIDTRAGILTFTHQGRRINACKYAVTKHARNEG